jgi:anaerobic selenocysteine-containing dehydrogenase
MAMRSITRRTFLKGSAATAGITAVGSLLSSRLNVIQAIGSAKSELQLQPLEEFVPTTCWIGKQDCGILARKVNGRIVKLEGQPSHPRNFGTLCPKGQGQIAALYDPNRVKTPLIRTNEKGVAGEFRAATWDEALTLVADRVTEVRNRDKRLLLWQKGRSKQKNFYDDAFVKASGATKLHHGAFCSDAGYRGTEYTVGLHGVMHPDFKHMRLLLCWGWNITAAGGNKFCWLTWNQQLVQAKERGLKVVAIDPRSRPAGPYVDEWVPIRPGTDLALALTLCNLLIQKGTIDEHYLKTYTNAAQLIKSDGKFLKSGTGDEVVAQIWDSGSNSVKDYGAVGTEPTLDGEFNVNGQNVKTAFRLFKEEVEQYTVPFAAETCGIPQNQVNELANLIAENAMIGATIVEDGQTLPIRPVGIMIYHTAQQELGFQILRAQWLLSMLIGAVGVPGGTTGDLTWKIDKRYASLDNIEITDTPNVYLDKSKFYPINSNNSSVIAKVMQDPGKYGVDYTPEVAILHMVNPMVSFASEPDIAESYRRLKFVAVIDPWLSRTADLFADVVLPAATMEKYEGPISATDGYTDATAMRVPIIDPMFDSKGDIDIYLDLCEKAGILFGEDGYLDQVNKSMKLEGEFAIDLNRKPTVREILDNYSRQAGIEGGVAHFENNGVFVKGPVAASKRYGIAMDTPYDGKVHRFYGESLLRYREQMQAAGVDQIYWQDYTPLPTWRHPTMNLSPAEYDLYLISFKLIEFKQARSSQIPLLSELAPKNRMDIHPETARVRGLSGGDLAVVESQNAITGETRQIELPVHLTAAIRPDVVGIPHHYGESITHPSTKGDGANTNMLFFTGEGYVSNTADQSFHVKVKVTKA